MDGLPEVLPEATAHLLAELGYLDLLLQRALMIARASRPAGEPDAFRGLVISEAEVQRLAETVEAGGEAAWTDAQITKLDRQIEQRRRALRAAAAQNDKDTCLPLARLAALFALSAAEIDLVLIALAPELDTRYETIYAYLQNDVTRKHPSVELAFNLICRSPEEKIAAHRLLAPQAPLLRFRIIALGEEAYDRQPTLLRRFLKLDDSVRRFLLGQSLMSTPGVAAVLPQDKPPELSTAVETRRAIGALIQSLQRIETSANIIHLAGRPGAPLQQAATAIGQALRRPLLIIDPARFAQDPDAAAAIVRDAVLWGALPVLARRTVPETETERAREDLAPAQFWEELSVAGQGAIVLGGAEDLRHLPSRWRLWRINISPPGFAARQDLWRETARDVGDADAERLADLFPFGAERIRQTCALALSDAALRDPSNLTSSMADLVRAGRALAAPSLQRFAVAVTPRFSWDDIVLPADRKQQLQSVAARVNNRAIVQRDWGFGEKLSRGRGVAVLLSGPAGTGKTMAAEVLANALSLDLFQIDLSTVVSKYIGETERQLSTIFAEAEQGQCILFFDECDAIFGKRTEVKDAHDRYANTEVNYLLQRLEQYEGTVLLATNFQKNIDEAFLRRLHDSIDFPFPDEAAREQIWRKQFPQHAPVDPNLDYRHLAAQFKLSGGHIRNAALYAAYRAAQDDGRNATIGMGHVLEGVHREFQKQGKLVVASDRAAAGWAR
jgi:MoxR-like ATPase